MKIQDVTIQNFRGISSNPFTVSLDPQLTVFIGSNGIGKSTILDAVSMVLSRIVNLIRFQKSSGTSFKETDFPIGQRFFDGTSISIIPVNRKIWELSKEKSKSKISSITDKEYTESIRAHIFETEEQCSIPLFVYYRTNRAVLDIPLKIRKKHDFSLLEAYEDALVGSANFRHFFEWFRNREDLENEIKNQERNLDYSDKQLSAVRVAIESVMNNFCCLSVRRNPLRMVIKKDGKELLVDHLSDGEKCMLAMIGDLARRLAIANPTLQEPLKGKGIVLIDEIELHLHPTWQKMILSKLCKVFPNCQFIVSTHSPVVLAELQNGKIFELSKQNDYLEAKAIESNNNYFLNDILKEFFDVDLNKDRIENVDKERQKKGKEILLNLIQNLQGNMQ
ncbi:MAG: AAA family ATPase [Campylobacterales bacterium]|nr:AAA family ATPase [Campylobacterales bacterium]